jgi:hypothetical protein
MNDRMISTTEAPAEVLADLSGEDLLPMVMGCVLREALVSANRVMRLRAWATRGGCDA